MGLKSIVKSIVKDEIDGLGLDANIALDIDSYEELYPSGPPEKDSYRIEISMGDKKDSYIFFWYNGKEKRMEHINLRLMFELSGKGRGRKLVELAENTGRKMGCDISRVNLPGNKIFWSRMGYKQNGDYWEKSLL